MINKHLKHKQINTDLISENSQLYKDLVLAALAESLARWEDEVGYSHTQYPDTEAIVDEADVIISEIIDYDASVRDSVLKEIKSQWYELGPDVISQSDAQIELIKDSIISLYKEDEDNE